MSLFGLYFLIYAIGMSDFGWTRTEEYKKYRFMLYTKSLTAKLNSWLLQLINTYPSHVPWHWMYSFGEFQIAQSPPYQNNFLRLTSLYHQEVSMKAEHFLTCQFLFLFVLKRHKASNVVSSYSSSSIRNQR